MDKLVTTNEAAQILGLSLQGVHYRIKNNQLKSKKQHGKTYVYINENLIENSSDSSNDEEVKEVKKEYEEKKEEYLEKILQTKNEQIEHMKETIHWMKKQYKSEIARLEHNQKKIIKVFDGEIKLLQSAFNEMRGVYKTQNNALLENQKVIHENAVANAKEKTQSLKDNYVNDNSSYPSFMDIKDFYKLMKSYGKKDNEIKIIILDRIKQNDKRFIFNKENKEVIIQKSDFLDLA